MPWSPSSVDTIVDVKKENIETVNRLLTKMDSLIALFTQLKTKTIEFDNELFKYTAMLDYEKNYAELAISYYNTALAQYVSFLHNYVTMGYKTESGIKHRLIKDVKVKQGQCISSQYSHTFELKLPEYSWITMPTYSVDNITVDLEHNLDPTNLMDNVIFVYIGNYKVALTKIDELSCVLDVEKILTTDTPKSLHELIAHFNKNILAIQNHINHINKVITEYELF